MFFKIDYVCKQHLFDAEKTALEDRLCLYTSTVVRGRDRGGMGLGRAAVLKFAQSLVHLLPFYSSE